MVDVTTVLRLVGGIILLFSNGFFVTTEFALTRVRQFDESEFTGRGLERAWEMTERLEIYLSGCQVGITVSSVGLGVVAEPALAAVLDPLVVGLDFASPTAAGHTALSVIVALAVINLLHVIIGEQAPTYLGIERTKLVAGYGSLPLYWWTKLMSPVILLSDRVAKGTLGLFGVEIARSWAEEEQEFDETATRGEVMNRMGDRLRGIGISEERREEVLNALAIDAILTEDIMIDREEIVAISTTDDIETNIERMADAPHGRFPLVGESLDEFHGIVYTPALIGRLEELTNGSLDLRETAAPPLSVDAEMPVSDLIDRLQQENQELALVERDGTVVGLVTATDAFEQITGELEDPLDAAA